MTLSRHWMALALAGVLWSFDGHLRGADPGSTTSSRSTGSTGSATSTGSSTTRSASGSSNASGSGAASSFGNTSGAESAPASAGFGSDLGPRPSFRSASEGLGASEARTPVTPTRSAIAPADSAAPAGESGLKPPTEAPASFSIPGLYGSGPLQLTAGEGILARPRFRYTATFATGYDDNVTQTPTDIAAVPEQRVRVQTAAATATSPARFRTVVIPGRPAPERQGSFILRGGAGVNIQFASRREVFTLDFGVGADYYFDRPGDKEEYNGRLSLVYLRKLTPRAQLTATVRASYQKQPDLTLVNAPTTNTQGNYLNLNSKADLSYRLTPRFSTVTSISYNTLIFEQDTEQSGNYGETVFGTELRYLFSPRVTLVGELRYSSIVYDSSSARDSHSYFLLTGGDFALSRRFLATVRVGASMRSFEEAGGSSIAPYLEATLSYQLARATQLRLNSRFGFEEPGDANSEVLTLRTGVTLSHAFTPRLRGNAGFDIVYSTSSNTNNNTNQTDLTSNNLELNLGLDYVLNRAWSFNANYTFSTLFSSAEAADFYRSRIFIGAQYLF